MSTLMPHGQEAAVTGVNTVLLQDQTDGFAPARIYTARYNDAAVSVIDTVTGREITSVSTKPSPHAVVVNKQGTRAYVQARSSISAIDTATNTIVDTVALAESVFGAISVHPDDTYVYAFDHHLLFVVETAGFTLAKTLSLDGCLDVAVHPSGNFVYAACTRGDDPFPTGVVIRIETAGHTVVRGLTMGANVLRLAISPAGDRLYAFFTDLFGASYIAVIDTATFTQVGTINVSQDFAPHSLDYAHHIVVSAAGDRLYALGDFGVYVYSLPSGALVTTVPLTGSTGLAVHPDGAAVFIARSDSNEIAVMDTATNTLSSAIPVHGPTGLAVLSGFE